MFQNSTCIPCHISESQNVQTKLFPYPSSNTNAHAKFSFGEHDQVKLAMSLDSFLLSFRITS